MKSRKLKAVLAAVSAIAVLATAMTGFAAATITTSTQYNPAQAGVAIVRTQVSGVSAEQYTLLVKAGEGGAGVDGNGTLFIFQSSTPDFNYKISTDPAIIGTDPLQAQVITGNNLGVTDETTLNIKEARDSYNGVNFTMQPNDDLDYIGTEVIDVAFVANDGYQMDRVVSNGKEYLYGFNSVELPFKNGSINSVGLEYATSEITNDVVISDVTKIADGTKVTTVMKVVGNPTEVGVIYDGHAYKSLAEDATFVAITLDGAGEITIDENEVTPYYVLDGVYYDADGVAIQ